MQPAALLQLSLLPTEYRDTSVRPRQKKQTKPVPYELTDLDYTLLTYVHEYYVLTVWQLVNLHYSPGSLTRAQAKLQLLSGNRKDRPAKMYLRRRGLHHLGIGNITQIYYLGIAGIHALTDLGLSVTSRHTRLDKMAELSYPPLIHALNVNDVLIAGRNLPKVAPDIRLASWRHDFELQTIPAAITVDRRHKDGGIMQEKVKIVPDGLLDFRLQLANADKERRRMVLVEIDRGTETNIEGFKRKIRAYVPYAALGGACEELFGKANKRVVWIVTKGGANRLATIKKWCEDELQDQGLTQEGGLFRFVCVDQRITVDKKSGKEKRSEELDIDPRSFFLTARAYKPFSDEPDTILWRP